MKKIEKIVIFWGACDIFLFIHYLNSSISNRKIPFYTDIINIINNYRGVFNGFHFYIIVTSLGVLLLVSFPISGILLILRKRSGAILAYCQTPFRIALVYPSAFFIFWAISYFGKPNVIIGIILLIVTEAIKIYTIILWQHIQKDSANQNLNRTVQLG